MYAEVGIPFRFRTNQEEHAELNFMACGLSARYQYILNCNVLWDVKEVACSSSQSFEYDVPADPYNECVMAFSLNYTKGMIETRS